MAARISFYIISLMTLAVFAFSPARTVGAAVVFFDAVAGLGQPVRLTVLTRKTLVAQGGKRVEVCIDQAVIAKILTGGDGYGYARYTPRTKGRWAVEVRSDGEKGSGTLLVVDATDRALLVDVETCLIKTLRALEQPAGMNRSLSALGEHYRIIYLARFLGVRLAKKLLSAFDLPGSVVLSWEGTKTLDELKQTGLTLHAMIAAPEILTEAAAHVPNRFAFEETENGEAVAGWDGLLKRLRP